MPLPNLPRFWPDYHSSRFQDPWHPSGVLNANMRRNEASSTFTLPTTATGTFAGGLVIPANFTINGIVYWPTAAGSTYTIKHFSLVNGNRVVFRSTGQSTATPTAGDVAAVNLSSPYTPPWDTTVYLVMSIAASTGPTVLASPAGNAAFIGKANPWAGTITGFTPTTTPPADAATLGTGFTTTMTQIPWWGLY